MPIPTLSEMPQHNRVLAVLPDDEMEKLGSVLEHVRLESGEVLWETDEKGRYLYFPTSALVSLMYDNDTGVSVSVASLGRRGVIGAGMLGGVRTPDRAVVTVGGSAFRLRASQANHELDECTEFHSLMLMYTTSLLTKVSQYAICNRLHRIDQQLARFLLECRDDLDTDVLSLTHDQIAGVLGVRRESISLSASQLQSKNVIRRGRGRIRITDARGLKAAACECYSIVKEHLDETLRKFRADHPQ